MSVFGRIPGKRETVLWYFHSYVNIMQREDFITTIADIDECSRGTDNCDLNADCRNTQGSFQCVCREGYEGNGRICTGNGESSHNQ